MLRWRTLTAAALAPVVLGAIMLGRWAIILVVLVVVARAAQELARALEPLPFRAALGAGTLPVLLAVPPFGSSGILAGAVLSLPWALFWLTGRPDARTLRAILALLLMALWVGAPLAHLILMGDLTGRGFSDGAYLVILAVIGPWISDSGAYFAGRLFGRHKIFPTLSPKKTVEGAIGGLLVTAAVLAPFAVAFVGFTYPEAVLMGLVISVFSQAGDLFESVLKRILDVKDLGRALPGHGGLLDRIDSLLFTAPAVYYLYVFFIL